MFRSLHSTHNLVYRAGPLVVKYLRGPNADRRYWSEYLTRKLLRLTNIDTIPIFGSSSVLRAILMPFQISTESVNSRVEPDQLINHLLWLSKSLSFPEETRCYWLSDKKTIRYFPDVSTFFKNELKRYIVLKKQLLTQQRIDQIGALFNQPDEGVATNVICLMDVCPKNFYARKETFVHFDFENTLIVPREVFLARCAMNFIRDLGCALLARNVAREMLQSCDSPQMFRKGLAFSLLRMLVYRAIFSSATLDPSDALFQLCDGAPSSEVLENMAYA